MKAIGVVLLAGLVIGLVREHPWLLAVAAVLVLLAFKVRSAGGAAAAGHMTAHVHAGHGPMYVAKHEAGHVVAAQRAGARVVSAQVWSDGSGLVHARGLRRPEDRVAFLRAGEYAMGSGSGAGHDRAAVRAVLREVPREDRRRVLRDGERMARQAARSGAVSGVARKLHQNGRL